MKFITVTQIQEDPYAALDCKQKESIISGKLSIPQKILEGSIILENKKLAPPRGFYKPGQIDYEYSTSTILLDCPPMNGKLSPLSVAENFELIQKQIEDNSEKKSMSILLHDTIYFKDSKFKVKTFILNPEYIIHVEEVTSSNFSIKDIVDEDRAKLKMDSLGEYSCNITTKLLDSKGMPKILHAIESPEYIYSKM